MTNPYLDQYLELYEYTPDGYFSSWQPKYEALWDKVTSNSLTPDRTHPLYSQYRDQSVRTHAARYELCTRYAWAIPTDEAIATVAKYSPLVEVGAGTGYWASLVRETGGDVQCFDVRRHLESTAWSEYGRAYAPIARGDEHRAMRMYPDRTLFLCWPYMNEMAYNSLLKTEAQRVIYVGEGWGGCCARDNFFEELDNNWEEETTVNLPQWDGMHDGLSVWARAGR